MAVSIGDKVAVINRKSWVGYEATVLDIVAEGNKVVVECGAHMTKRFGMRNDSYAGTKYTLPADIVVPIE